MTPSHDPATLAEIIDRQRDEQRLFDAYLKAKADATDAKALWQNRVRSNERFRAALLETHPLFDRDTAPPPETCEEYADRKGRELAEAMARLAERRDGEIPAAEKPKRKRKTAL